MSKSETNDKVVRIDIDAAQATRGGVPVRSGVKGGRSQSDAQKTTAQNLSV